MQGELDPNIRSKVEDRLDDLARLERVAIPLAVESGSRAWGFPSPDSDFDCRFIYVRPAAAYFSPWPARDVIEAPVEGELDINGWDVVKAVKLLAKGNAAVLEWLMSPISYRVDETFRAGFLALAEEIVERNAIATHYLRLGRRQRDTYLVGQEYVPLKKIFYAVRPAAALRWLSQRPDARVAPMDLPTLLQQCAPPRDVAIFVESLIAKKRITRDLGTGAVPPSIRSFIDTSFEAAPILFPPAPQSPSPAVRVRAERFIQTMIRRYEPVGRAQVPPTRISTRPAGRE